MTLAALDLPAIGADADCWSVFGKQASAHPGLLFCCCGVVCLDVATVRSYVRRLTTFVTWHSKRRLGACHDAETPDGVIDGIRC